MLVLLSAILSVSNAYAGPENLLVSLDRGLYVETSLRDVDIKKDYALGIHRHDLDDHTELLGWQLGDSLYFGRQDGIDSGLTLVWQQKANQFSLSKEGLRLTRRF